MYQPNYYNYPGVYGSQMSQAGYSHMSPNSYNQNQMQMQQAQQMQNQMQQPPSLTIIPVASKEEVMAHAVDWTGQPTYFVDNAHDCIHVKKLGLDGIPVVSSYKKDVSTGQSDGYVTRQEFDTVKSTLDNLLLQLGGGNNVQSNANDANAK